MIVLSWRTVVSNVAWLQVAKVQQDSSKAHALSLSPLHSIQHWEPQAFNVHFEGFPPSYASAGNSSMAEHASCALLVLQWMCQCHCTGNVAVAVDLQKNVVNVKLF